MVSILIRTIFIYLYLILCMRLTGKRQIGELQLSELITALLLSELAAAPTANPSIPLLHAILPITALISLEIIGTMLVTKSVFIRRILDGVPSIIINRGKLDIKALSDVRMSVEELMAELRLKGYAHPEDVFYAILEQNGKLSVIPRVSAVPPAAADAALTLPEKGISHLLIVDGNISDKSLRFTSKSRAWLFKRLKSLGYSSEKEIFIFAVDDTGGEYICAQNERSK